jgi:hypothetical protein
MEKQTYETYVTNVLMSHFCSSECGECEHWNYWIDKCPHDCVVRAAWLAAEEQSKKNITQMAKGE